MNDDVNENDDDYRVNNVKATTRKYFECKTIILTHETKNLLFKCL